MQLHKAIKYARARLVSSANLHLLAYAIQRLAGTLHDGGFYGHSTTNRQKWRGKPARSGAGSEIVIRSQGTRDSVAMGRYGPARTLDGSPGSRGIPRTEERNCVKALSLRGQGLSGNPPLTEKRRLAWAPLESFRFVTVRDLYGGRTGS